MEQPDDGSANKAEAFKAFHTRPQPLLLPNPWDVGSAKYFAHMVEALASTSLGQRAPKATLSRMQTRFCPTKGDLRRHGSAG